MDPAEFYHNATIQICGSLELEQALLDSIRFLRRAMPVDKLFMQFFDVGLRAFRTVAITSPDGTSAKETIVPHSEEGLNDLKRFVPQFENREKNIVWLFENEDLDMTVIREYFGFHKTPVTSLLVIPLGLQKQMLGQGSIFLVTTGEQRFTQEHADLLAPLKEPFAIAMSNALRHRQVQELRDRLADDNRYLRQELRRITGDRIIGADFGLREVMGKVGMVAPTDSPVLLMGETGVGKDIIASAIHMGSPRRDGPFVAVNCGAIPESLLDSELFGHEKGAFTGALTEKRGRFERAHQGTILLDEIGEMPLEAQVRLLRVLENHEVERIGGSAPIPLDIRVIAATNKDLEQAVREGTFREDLWFRLNVFPILVTPLRERTGDIPALVQHFIARKTLELKIAEPPRLAQGAIDILMDYDWPGNVRELENVVERAMILQRGEPLGFGDLDAPVGASSTPHSGEQKEPLDLDALMARHIRRVLDMTGGKIHGPGGAGEVLGVNPNTLRNKMKKLGIPFSRDARE